MYVGLMKTPRNFNRILKGRGYSTNAIEEMWKWYDSSKRKGVASF